MSDTGISTNEVLLRERAELAEARAAELQEALSTLHTQTTEQHDRLVNARNEWKARSAELEARAAQLREALERVAYIKWQDEGGAYAKCRLCHAVDGHEAYCILSATPAQSAAYLSALEAEHEAAMAVGAEIVSNEWREKIAAVEAAKDRNNVKD